MTVREDRRRGSAASDKAMFFAAKDGRLITAYMPGGDEIEGYLCGVDDYHWTLVTTDGDTVLIHKTIPAVRISANRTFRTEHEEVAARIEQATSSFRALAANRTSGRSDQSA